MKYAKEVIDLMAAYPGRDWRMAEIVRYIGGKPEDRHFIRKGVSRVIATLAESGLILVRPPRNGRGGFATYRWKR